MYDELYYKLQEVNHYTKNTNDKLYKSQKDKC